MTNSRLERVRSRKAGKQGVTYLVIAVLLIIATIAWGLPAIAKITGILIKTDNVPFESDEQRPAPPIFSDIPQSTYSAQVKIAGYAQPGLDVILFINGAEFDRKLVSESGTFNFDKVNLTEGENTAYGYSGTINDLRSEQSKTYVIAVDTTKPIVKLDSPKDGEVFRGQAQRFANFVGSVNEHGTTVYFGEQLAKVTTEDQVSLTIQLVEGDQDIQIKAIDKAGNESVSSIKLRWEP